MKHALCVGLNYTGSQYELPDCHLDADAITKRALDAGYRCDKYTGKFGADDFIGEVVRLRENAKKSDVTLISYSGHGTQWYDGDSTERDRHEEGLCFWNGSQIEVFPDDDFRLLLNEIKGTVYVFLDSCFSGGMERAAGTKDWKWQKKCIPFDPAWEIIEYEPSSARMAVALSNKIYFLNASDEDEYALSTGTGGLFTKSFCAGYDRTRDKRTIKSLMTYAADVCADDQTPNYIIYGGNASKRVF